MPAITPRKIVCTACGRTAPYRPEMAGTRVKCKCGNIIDVPKPQKEPAPSQPLPTEPPANDLYDIRVEPKSAKPQRVVAAESPAVIDTPLPRAPMPNMCPTMRRPKTEGNAEEKSALLGIAIIAAILVVLVVAAIVGIKKFGGSHHPTTPQLAEDADIEEKIQDEYSKDVHAWFQEDHARILGPWSESQALAQADRWQQQGAKRILAFGRNSRWLSSSSFPMMPPSESNSSIGRRIGTRATCKKSGLTLVRNT